MDLSYFLILCNTYCYCEISESFNQSVNNGHDYIEQVLTGMLLGDGWLELSKINARLRFEQSHIHSEYFFFSFKYFALFCIGPAVLRLRFDKRTNKTYRTYHFSTRSLPFFTKWHNLFYRDGKKIVPSIIGTLLTPVSLAIWIIDDGCFTGSGIVLQTNNFKLSDVELLVKTLKVNFDLFTYIRFERGQPVIYVPKGEMSKLRAIVTPHICPARSAEYIN